VKDSVDAAVLPSVDAIAKILGSDGGIGLAFGAITLHIDPHHH
jgi:hypothetical protein